jgi:uncharacterized SAM-binding protein YcdF (DUF218 family)
MFVLAGAKVRKLQAWSEFRQGEARKLMLSTSRFELRKFPGLPVFPKLDLIALAAPIPHRLRHCCVLFEGGEAQVIWVRKKRLGTMTEIEFLGKWLRENPDMKTVRVVSSDNHLRRIRLCCRFLLPATVHVEFEGVRDPGAGIWTSAKEWGKFWLYEAVLRWQRFSGKLRGDGRSG